MRVTLAPLTVMETLLWTLFGIMPGAAFYVYLGALGREAGSGGAGPVRWIVLGAGLVLTALVLWLVIRRANTKLTELGIGRR